MDRRINRGYMRPAGLCGCGMPMNPAQKPYPEQCGPSLAMVYPVMQTWRNLYDPCKAIARGTLFAELDMPWVGCNGSGRGYAG